MNNNSMCSAKFPFSYETVNTCSVYTLPSWLVESSLYLEHFATALFSSKFGIITD